MYHLVFEEVHNTTVNIHYMNIKQHKNNNKTGHTQKKKHTTNDQQNCSDIRYIPNHTTALQAEHNNRSSAQEHNNVNVNDSNKYIYSNKCIYIYIYIYIYI